MHDWINKRTGEVENDEIMSQKIVAVAYHRMSRDKQKRAIAVELGLRQVEVHRQH